ATTGVPKSQLESVLREKLSATHVEATDKSDGCGQNFEVIVVSALFEGKPLLARHRLVNDAAKDEISKVHAFSQKCYTPQQW
ncbi:bola-like protein, partial [Rhizoclosmatium globosum]